MIGCTCHVCTSAKPENRRFRPSVLVSQGNRNILVDATPDLRSQALAYRVDHVDAVFFTHAHADHILGVDDLRLYNYRSGKKLPCYADKVTLHRLKTVFDYAFDDRESEQSRPTLLPHLVDGRFELFGLAITPLELFHGKLQILGFLFEDEGGHRFGYATDCSFIPQATQDLLKGIDLLVLDALRYDPHPTHLSLSQAVEIARNLGPKQTLFTHIAHQLEHETVNSNLPAEIHLAYDGQVVHLDRNETK